MKKNNRKWIVGGLFALGFLVAVYIPPNFFRLSSDSLFAGAGPAIEWAKTFGGTNDDWADSVQQTIDGGYIIAGLTKSFGAGDSDAYLIKTDSDGNLSWQKTFGGTDDDYANSVQQTADHGYIIAGDTKSFGAGKSDAYLAKIDANGNLQWQKTFGGTGDDWATCVQQTPDGGYIIAGLTESFSTRKFGYAGSLDAYLIKTDSEGNLQWQKTFGGTGDDCATFVQQTSDAGYIIAGWTKSFGAGKSDAYLAKTDCDGNRLWQKTFGGTDDDWATSVQQTPDAGYVIAGRTESFGAGKSDAYLAKTDCDGNRLWQKTLGGTGDDWATSVQQTTDSGYIVAGLTKSFGAGGFDAYLVKIAPE